MPIPINLKTCYLCSLKGMFFERENKLDFALSRQMSQMTGQYTDRVAHRLELIDLSKARAFMTAISQIQIKVLKKISFVVQMRRKYKLNHKRGKLFRTSYFGKWLDLAYFDHEPHMIDYMLQRQCYVNDAHYDMLYVHGRGIHFGRREFSLITGLRFEEVSFSCYSKGDLKYRSRVFPHRLGLKITSLDLIGVIEDEEFFSKLCVKDAVRVCLLLSLEVIFMGRKLVQEFDDTLMRLVENLEAWNAFP
ncbi:phospholipase-like protein [Tanacetum coccineum]